MAAKDSGLPVCPVAVLSHAGSCPKDLVPLRMDFPKPFGFGSRETAGRGRAYSPASAAFRSEIRATSTRSAAASQR